MLLWYLYENQTITFPLYFTVHRIKPSAQSRLRLMCHLLAYDIMSNKCFLFAFYRFTYPWELVTANREKNVFLLKYKPSKGR